MYTLGCKHNRLGNRNYGGATGHTKILSTEEASSPPLLPEPMPMIRRWSRIS